MMTDICCIGHITHDTIITPRATVEMAGGTAYYFAHALASLPPRLDYSLITAIHPADSAPVDELRSRGVSVTVIPSGHTVEFVNQYADQGNDRTQRVPVKADPFTVEQLANVEARVFHLGTLLADDFAPEVVESLSQRGRVSIDVQGYLREVVGQDVRAADWEDKLRVLKHTYYIKVNEQEMTTITGETSPREAARMLNKWGAKEVIVTLGDKGSLVYARKCFTEVPAFPPSEVIDATGCGDTYSAGYLTSRLLHKSAAVSGRFAAAMCTLKLEHNGPFLGSELDVDRLISKHQDLLPRRK